MLLAAGSSDGEVSIVRRHKYEFALATHSAGCGPVTAVSWGCVTKEKCTQSLLLATAGSNNTAKVWEYDGVSERLREEMKWDYGAAVRDVAFANSQGLPYNLLAMCFDDRRVRIYKQIGGKWNSPFIIETKVDVWRVSWSLAGNLLAVSAADNVVFVYEEKEIDNWELVVHTGKDSS